MDFKQQVDRNVSKMITLKDEIRVQLHLASLDAKREWNEKLEPKILELEGAAKEAGEASREAIEDLVARLEKFAKNLKS